VNQIDARNRTIQTTGLGSRSPVGSDDRPALWMDVAERFHQLRRSTVYHPQSADPKRSWLGDLGVGVYVHLCRKLASVHLAVARAGLSALRAEAGRPSPHQSHPACCQHRPGLPVVAADDWRALAQRTGGCLVCLASLACRISGLGLGTERCLEHLFRIACLGRVGALRAETRRQKPEVRN